MNGIYGLLGNRTVSEGIIVSLIFALVHDNKRSKSYSKLYSCPLLHMKPSFSFTESILPMACGSKVRPGRAACKSNVLFIWITEMPVIFTYGLAFHLAGCSAEIHWESKSTPKGFWLKAEVCRVPLLEQDPEPKEQLCLAPPALKLLPGEGTRGSPRVSKPAGLAHSCCGSSACEPCSRDGSHWWWELCPQRPWSHPATASSR